MLSEVWPDYDIEGQIKALNGALTQFSDTQSLKQSLSMKSKKRRYEEITNETEMIVLRKQSSNLPP